MIQINYFTFNAFSENTYILYDETKEAVVIDPGCHDSYEQGMLQSFVKEKGLTIVKLLNTHCHIDHILGNEFIKKTYQVQAYAHEAEDFNIGTLPTAAKMFGITHVAPTRIDAYIGQGDSIAFGNSSLEVIFTPGHSPGHVVFYHPAQGFCINGDVLFRMSIGRTDLPGGNHRQLIESIEKKMFILPDETVIYTGHGNATTIGFEKINNPFL